MPGRSPDRSRARRRYATITPAGIRSLHHFHEEERMMARDLVARLGTPTSLVLLQPLLEALGATDSAILKPTGSLPVPCFAVPNVRTLVCATPINTLPVFRAAMISVAAIEKMDVVVVRHGFAPELLDEVTIDVVVGRTRAVHMLWTLCGYRHGDGGLWLVPPPDGAGPSVLLDARGLTIMPEPPYGDEDERSDGVTRAARETVRAMRRLRNGR